MLVPSAKVSVVGCAWPGIVPEPEPPTSLALVEEVAFMSICECWLAPPVLPYEPVGLNNF